MGDTMASSPIDSLTASIDALDGPSTTANGHHHHGPGAAAAGQGCYPTVRLVFEHAHVESELRRGVRELCKHAVRRNFEWVAEGQQPKKKGPDEHWWLIRLAKDDALAPRQLSIVPSHSDFTDLAGSHIASSDLPSSQFTLQIRYNRPCEAFRAIGTILAQTRHSTAVGDPPDGRSSTNGDADPHQPVFEWSGDTADLDRTEKCLFDTLGVMIDCSRNGVLLVERVEELLRFLALMGCNMIQLYTEDTYEVRCARKSPARVTK